MPFNAWKHKGASSPRAVSDTVAKCTGSISHIGNDSNT